MTPEEIENKNEYPNCCRRLFTNCDDIISCDAPFGDDVTEEMCFEGKYFCEFRINRWNGKECPEGII